MTGVQRVKEKVSANELEKIEAVSAIIADSINRHDIFHVIGTGVWQLINLLISNMLVAASVQAMIKRGVNRLVGNMMIAREDLSTTKNCLQNISRKIKNLR